MIAQVDSAKGHLLDLGGGCISVFAPAWCVFSNEIHSVVLAGAEV